MKRSIPFFACAMLLLMPGCLSSNNPPSQEILGYDIGAWKPRDAPASAVDFEDLEPSLRSPELEGVLSAVAYEGRAVASSGAIVHDRWLAIRTEVAGPPPGPGLEEGGEAYVRYGGQILGVSFSVIIS